MKFRKCLVQLAVRIRMWRLKFSCCLLSFKCGIFSNERWSFVQIFFLWRDLLSSHRFIEIKSNEEPWLVYMILLIKYASSQMQLSDISLWHYMYARIIVSTKSFKRIRDLNKVRPKSEIIEKYFMKNFFNKKCFLLFAFVATKVFFEK